LQVKGLVSSCSSPRFSSTWKRTTVIPTRFVSDVGVTVKLKTEPWTLDPEPLNPQPGDEGGVYPFPSTRETAVSSCVQIESRFQRTNLHPPPVRAKLAPLKLAPLSSATEPYTAPSGGQSQLEGGAQEHHTIEELQSTMMCRVQPQPRQSHQPRWQSHQAGPRYDRGRAGGGRVKRGRTPANSRWAAAVWVWRGSDARLGSWVEG
jgi:hypothetical protein